MTATVRSGLAVLVGMLMVALAACGSGDPQKTNGVEELPAERIEQRARNAAREARTVRLSGTVRTGGTSYRIDLRLTTDGAVGEISTGETTFELLRIGDDLYLSGDAEFWESKGVPEELTSDPTEKLDGKYVKVAQDDESYEELSRFTEKNVLLDGLLTLEGERETGERGEIDGTETIRVAAGGGAGGAIDVALTGRPYPLRLRRGGGAGVLSMTDWNESFTLYRPKKKQIVDYGDEMITDGDQDGGSGGED